MNPFMKFRLDFIISLRAILRDKWNEFSVEK